MRQAEPASTIDRLALAVSAEPHNDALWRLYADALSEAGQLPEFFKHALAGGAVPDLKFIPGMPDDVQMLIDSGSLQLTFNRFHFLEEASIKAWTNTRGLQAFQAILKSGVANFVQALHIDEEIFGAFWQLKNSEALRRDPNERFSYDFSKVFNDLLRESGVNGLPALRDVSLGVWPRVTPGAERFVALVSSHSPHFRTRADQLIRPQFQLRIRVISGCRERPPGDLRVGMLLPADCEIRCVTNTKGAFMTPSNVLRLPWRREEACVFTSSRGSSSVGLVIERGLVHVNDIPEWFESPSGTLDLEPGDTIELGGGLTFCIEAE